MSYGSWSSASCWPAVPRPPRISLSGPSPRRPGCRGRVTSTGRRTSLTTTASSTRCSTATSTTTTWTLLTREIAGQPVILRLRTGKARKPEMPSEQRPDGTVFTEDFESGGGRVKGVVGGDQYTYTNRGRPPYRVEPSAPAAHVVPPAKPGWVRG